MRTRENGAFQVVDGTGRVYGSYPTVRLAMSATHRLKGEFPDRVFSVRRGVEVR